MAQIPKYVTLPTGSITFEAKMLTKSDSHWWDANTAAQNAVLDLKDVGPGHSKEDVTWKAWESILSLYFPTYAATPDGVKYMIRREAYRSLVYQPESTRPDVVVVKLSDPRPNADGYNRLVRPVNSLLNRIERSNAVPRSVKRDILWVECKAPNHDSPGLWADLMLEAVERLEDAHPDRNV